MRRASGAVNGHKASRVVADRVEQRVGSGVTESLRGAQESNGGTQRSCTEYRHTTA